MDAIDWLVFVSAFSCERLRQLSLEFGTFKFIEDTIPHKFYLSAYLPHTLYVFFGCGKLNELDWSRNEQDSQDRHRHSSACRTVPRLSLTCHVATSDYYQFPDVESVPTSAPCKSIIRH